MPTKITMIGLSGAGKTCYLVATAAKMINGVSNYMFAPTNYDQGLELSDMWNSLYADNATWFPGTAAETKEYSFRCFYNGQVIATNVNVPTNDVFTWVDYRGGLFGEAGGDDPDTEVGRFLERCVDSVALIVAIPGDVLARNADDPDFQRMFTKYKFILGPMFAKYPTRFRKLAIVLAITKADCITSKAMMLDRLNRVKQQFQFCFDPAQRACMITAVSLGKFENATQGAPVEGEISPQNIHLPVLLPFYLQFKEKEQDERNSATNADRNAEREEKKSKFAKFFHDEGPWWRRQARQHRERADALKSVADNIENEFRNNVILYRYGECKLDVGKP